MQHAGFRTQLQVYLELALRQRRGRSRVEQLQPFLLPVPAVLALSVTSIAQAVHAIYEVAIPVPTGNYLL